MGSPSSIITLGLGPLGSGGDCDYPGVADVRLGVTYGSGVYTGTLSFGGTGSNNCPASMDEQDTQRWIPWTTSITVTNVRPNSTNIETAVTCAAVYRLGNGESSPAYGVFTHNDILTTFDKDAVAFTPKPRDTVVWGTDTFTVLETNGSDFLDFWKLTCRNIVAHADLRSSGTLSRPTTAQDSAFRQALSTYSDVTTSIPCRVQPANSAATDIFGRRHIPGMYVAFVGVQLSARAKDRFTVGSTHYTVLEYRDSERIDEPNKLLLQLVA